MPRASRSTTAVVATRQRRNRQPLGEASFTAYEPVSGLAHTILPPPQREHLDALILRLANRHSRQRQSTQEHRSYLADASVSAGFRLSWKDLVYATIVQRASGARMWDLDGNEYVDIAMGFGALLYGHSPGFLLRAVAHQLDAGLQLGPNAELVGPNARLLCELTGNDRATFCNSGTEAVMIALRLARTVTGRTKVAFFTGSYHGTFDPLMMASELTSDRRIRAVPMCPGVPLSYVEDVLLLEHGQPDSLTTLQQHADELAAVLVEPQRSRYPADDHAEFLRRIRALTRAADVPLIFDEMITGFRVHPRGMQGLLGLQADLTTYGKALGGGVLPVAAVAGRARFMDAIDGGNWRFGDASYPSATQTFVAGTYFKHPLAMAAVQACLEHMREQGPKLQVTLTKATARLASRLNNELAALGAPLWVEQFGSLFVFQFSPRFRHVDRQVFFFHLLERGVYTWEGRTCFLSTVHTDRDISHIIDAACDTVRDMQAVGFLLGDAGVVPGDR